MPGTLSRYVYDELLEKIYSGEISRGQKLPSEEELTATYKVSRPVIRSALMQLRKDGLIESRRGVGSFVKHSSFANKIFPAPVENYEDIISCFEFRASLEGQMAFYAALRANANDKINIQRAYDQTLTHHVLDNVTAMELDLAFHMTIAEATHNRFFTHALQTINQQILKGMHQISKYFVRNQSTHSVIKEREHSFVLEAILAGDAPMAKSAMELHIIRSKNWLKPNTR